MLVSGESHVVQHDVINTEDDDENTSSQVDYKPDDSKSSQNFEARAAKYKSVLLDDAHWLIVVVDKTENSGAYVSESSKEGEWDHFDEQVVVLASNAVVYIGTVVVKLVNTSVASSTVLSSIRNSWFTSITIVMYRSRVSMDIFAGFFSRFYQWVRRVTTDCLVVVVDQSSKADGVQARQDYRDRRLLG